MTDAPQRILVMGVGNPLMRDEGIGPRVAELLMTTYDFPEHVEIADAGTMGYSILNMFTGFDHLIIVDAMRDSGHPAGTVLVLTPEALANGQVMHSLHDTRLVDVLGAAALIDRAPETICVVMQIEEIVEWVLELSAPCEGALPLAAGAVLDRLRELGVSPKVRADAAGFHARVIEALRSYAPMPEAPIASQPEAQDD
ncbi:MAG: hydrogenase maturation protease [Coriobacteriia bacterium]|nr:hydrogenase maturation protease [Coriobacteriia bacterium]